MKVHELLDAPEKWTQGRSARNAAGEGTATIAQDACRWCFFGALMYCYPDEYGDIRRDLQSHLGRDVVPWNDESDRTFEDVRALALELDI